jgi:AraC-like DNA-binding protein
MYYEEYIINSEPITKYVSCIWKIDSTKQINSFSHVPKCQSLLIFNFGGNITIENAEEQTSIIDNIIVFPVYSTAIRIIATEINWIGISFKKDGLFRLLNKPIQDLRFQLPLQYKDDFIVLRNSILNCDLQTVAEKIKPFLIEHINLCEDLKGFQKALNLIHSTNGCLSIMNVCEKSGISERSLQRHFKQRLGLSPKKYSKILRVNMYLDRFMEHKSEDWIENVVNFNYYDQPHLINEFKSIMKLSPGDLIKYKNTLYHNIY